MAKEMRRRAATRGSVASDGGPPGGVSSAPAQTGVQDAPKTFRMALFAAFVCGPPALSFLLLDINPVARRAILINLAMSVAGFFLTVYMIPVAIPYVLRRGIGGFDINKRGSPAGEIKM